MKKIFVVVLCVVCLLSLMIIPAFADAERFEIGDVWRFVSYDVDIDAPPSFTGLLGDVGISADDQEFIYISNFGFRESGGQLQYQGRTEESGQSFVYLNVSDYPYLKITGFSGNSYSRDAYQEFLNSHFEYYNEPYTPVIEKVTSVFASGLDIGSGLIDFIVLNPICALPLVMWLGFALFGLFKRLVVGA